MHEGGIARTDLPPEGGRSLVAELLVLGYLGFGSPLSGPSLEYLPSGRSYL